VTETTTVAAAYALGAFSTISSNSFATDSSSVAALQGAVAYANSLVNSNTGTIPAGSGWTATMNTLADMMAACIDSTYLSECFTDAIATTPPGGYAPTNTFQAAINVALNPNLDLSAAFAQVSSVSPYQPILTALPASWALPGLPSQILGVSPESAPVGSPITIGGTGFGANQGSSVVIINGIQANISSWSDTAIVAVVPSGASTNGVIQVCANLVCSNNVPFAIGTTLAPIITALSLYEGPPLMGFVITGANFGGVQGSLSGVTLGDFPNQTQLTVLSWSTSQIKVQIPQNVVTGGGLVVTVGTLPTAAFQSDPVIFSLTSPFGCTIP
jgi:hypothetical protein